MNANAHNAMLEQGRGPEATSAEIRRHRVRDGAVDTGRSGGASAGDFSQVLGSLVHAVSNSLNSIMAASQLANLLITQHRLGEARISLDRAEEECLRAARLLRDGRGLATLHVPATLDGVDAAVLLTACAAACSDLGDVRVECDANLPLVRGQADALKRLFVEILDNAFQFGAHNVTIAAEADRDRGVVEIEFKDDGPGLQARSTEIFEPYVTSEPAEHTGLGLAFAAQIAAAYDGAVGIGKSSAGAVFWVRLPVASR